MKAQILLSTWNGEHYIPELLESLIHQQTSADLHILVRDDGSTDRSAGLVEEYAKANDRIALIRGANCGVDRSFHALMEAAAEDADFYFFCDQDDVWLPGKVQAAVDALSDFLTSGKPVMYCSRSMVTDSSLKKIGPTRDYASPTFAKALVMNVAPGHTMALNRELLLMVREHFDAERIMIFDHWTYLIAAGLGAVIFDHNWYTLYRNHEANAIGYSLHDSWRKRWTTVIQKDFGAFARQAQFFEGEFVDLLQTCSAARLRGFTHQGSWVDRLHYLQKFGIEHGPILATVSSALLFLVGRYRP